MFFTLSQFCVQFHHRLVLVFSCWFFLCFIITSRCPNHPILWLVEMICKIYAIWTNEYLVNAVELTRSYIWHWQWISVIFNIDCIVCIVFPKHSSIRLVGYDSFDQLSWGKAKLTNYFWFVCDISQNDKMGVSCPWLFLHELCGIKFW